MMTYYVIIIALGAGCLSTRPSIMSSSWCGYRLLSALSTTFRGGVLRLPRNTIPAVKRPQLSSLYLPTSPLSSKTSLHHHNLKYHSRKQSQPSWSKFFYPSLGGLGACLITYCLFRNKRQAEEFQLKPEFWFATAKCIESDEGSRRRSKQYNFLAEAVEVAAPAVVYIEKSQSVPMMFGGGAMSVSSGSGFIVDERGYVLTNAHVVGNAPRVKVRLISGRVVTGEVTDIDQITDLALVKLDVPANEKLPSLKFGSSSDLRPGEWVVALGSPLSLSNTITAGIVSSVNRPSKELGLQYHKPDMEYIQTDAPITVGNSGGPLVNLDGEVIGVNTLTAQPGISFAIPSNFAKEFVKNANKTTTKRKQAPEKYAIGISMISVSPTIIRAIPFLSSDVTHGVLLANVWPKGPAAQVGLQKGDVIVRIDGKNIHSSREVFQMVQSGRTLTMEIVRGSRRMTATVKPELLYSG